VASNRALHWLQLIADYGIASILTRALGALSALLLVRALSVENFAVLTLALTALTLACTLSDLGATETLAYFKRRAAIRSRDWRPYWDAIVELRSWLLFLGLVLALAYLIHTVHQLRISVTLTPILAGLVIVGAWCMVRSSALAYAMRLVGALRHSYAVDLTNEGIKFLFAVVIFFAAINSPTLAFVGTVAAACGSYFVARALQRSVQGLAIERTGKKAQRRRRFRLLLGQVKHVVPAAIYAAAQGPLVVWLVSENLGVRQLGEMGALGRIAAVLALVSGFLVTVVVPKLSGVVDDKRFLRLYWRLMLMLVAVGVAVTLMCHAFPQYILLLLGSPYLQLAEELMLVTLMAVIGTYVTFMWQVNRLRGWIRAQVIRIPLLLCWQAYLLFALELSSLSGVLRFSLYTMLMDASFQFFVNMHGFYRRSQIRVTALK
jgi:O-antigen/teichoic acid export membrane protein